MIVITVSAEGTEPRTLRFEGDRIRIGREADNDLVLDSEACSRYHAMIVREHGAYKIVDLDSTNGVVYAGERVRQLPLTHGIAVMVGDQNLVIAIPQQETPRTVMMSMDEIAAGPGVAEAVPMPAARVLYLIHRAGNRRLCLTVASGVEYLIGRSPDADLIIDDNQASARHAEVVGRDDRFLLKDLDSANGTLVNGDRVRQAELNPGDEITIGRTKIAVSDEKDEPAEEAALLARTQLGIPVPEGIADGSPSPVTEKPGRRLAPTLIAVAAVAIAVMLAVLVFRGRRPSEAVPDSQAESVIPIDASPSGTGSLIVQVAPVLWKELVTGIEGTGTVKAQRSVTVSSEVASRVVDLAVEEGAHIEKGQLLARLNDRDLRLQIEEAKSTISEEQVRLAREDWERKQRLFEGGVVTRSVLDQAKNNYLQLDAAYRSTQARISQLREGITKTRIAAPMTGTVAATYVNEGEFVTPGAPVARVENLDEVLVEIEVSDRDVVKIHPGQSVDATCDAYPDTVFPGAVASVASTASPVTRTFKVEARISNPEGRLRSGMIGSLNIMLDRRRGLVVPATALLEVEGGSARVYVVSDGRAAERRVELGGRRDREAEITDGLAEGELVIVSGLDRVADGRPVEAYRE